MTWGEILGEITKEGTTSDRQGNRIHFVGDSQFITNFTHGIDKNHESISFSKTTLKYMPRLSSLINSLFRRFFATGELVVRSVADNFLTAAESFEAQDNRLYKSSFGETGELLDTSHKGFCLNGYENLRLSDSYRNVLLLGNTGSGKGVNVILPSLLSMGGATLICHDPSGENALKTSGYFASKGYKIHIVNFSKPDESDSFNPMDNVTGEADINKLSALLVRTSLGSNSSDPYWSIQATNILRIFIAIVLTQSPEYRTLPNVLHLITAFRGNPKSVDKIFIRFASDKLMEDYKSYVAMDNKLLSSIVSTAQASLQLFSSPDVAKTMSTSTVDFRKIRQEKTIIYLQTSTADSVYYKVLTSIFFEQLLQFLLSHLPDKNELDTFLILDEASSLNLPTLPLAQTNLRKHRCGILTAWQSKQQIVHSYGSYDAETIIDNALTKVYLTGQGLQTTKELEAILGRTQVIDGNDRAVIKPLMLSEEIRQMHDKQALIICGNLKPFKVDLKPYYEQPFLNLRTKRKPVQHQNIQTKNPLAFIPL